MFSKLTPTYKGILFALLGYSCFSFADVGTKWLAQDYPIYQVIAVENLFSLLALLAFAAPLGGARSLWNADAREDWRIHSIRAVLNVAINLLIIYSFTQLPLASVYTVAFLIPFVAAMIAMPLYGEVIHAHRWGAIIAGFSGVLIAFRPWENTLPLSLWAVLLLIPITVATSHVIAKSFQRSSALAMAFWPLTGSFVFTMPVAAFDFKPIDWMHFPIFAFSGASVAMAILLLAIAYKEGEASSASPMLYFQMIWGVTFGYIFFGDVPDGWMLLGAGIIIISGIYLIMRERKIAKVA